MPQYARIDAAVKVKAGNYTHMMESIPIIFVIFKALVLGTGMFYAIKWHYDQGKKGKVQERRAVLRAAGKVAAIFVLSLVALGLLTYFLLSKLSLDMGLS